MQQPKRLTETGEMLTPDDTIQVTINNLMNCSSVYFFSGKALLVNTLVYSVFVRIWYDYNTYAVFKTNGIFVMTQAPVLATKQGAVVSIIYFGRICYDLMHILLSLEPIRVKFDIYVFITITGVISLLLEY